ncbi:MAG TPA: reverse transcriptase domain-containing protein, partial [Aquella sp.]|nr:reverse transcriptase domain-containing protein [Aquella sp.]
VSNAKDCSAFLNSIKIPDDHIIVSFDVNALYTSVPVSDALQALSQALDKLRDDDLKAYDLDKFSIMTLVNACLKDNYFNFNGTCYSQNTGLAMGNPLSAVLANIFMANIDDKINEYCPFKLLFWLRYVDDVITAIHKDHVYAVLSFINLVHPNIKFTVETESNNTLAFLDLKVLHINNDLFTTVYRKPMSSNYLINFNSYHAQSQKAGLIYGLIHRAQHVCSNTYLRNLEIEFIKDCLYACQFPVTFVDYHIKKALEKFTTPRYMLLPCVSGPLNEEQSTRYQTVNNNNRKFIGLPYDKHLEKNICKTAAEVGLSIGFKPGAQLKKPS